MLDAGFAQYSEVTLHKAGDTIANARVFGDVYKRQVRALCRRVRGQWRCIQKVPAPYCACRLRWACRCGAAFRLSLIHIYKLGDPKQACAWNERAALVRPQSAAVAHNRWYFAAQGLTAKPPSA